MISIKKALEGRMLKDTNLWFKWYDMDFYVVNFVQS